MGICYCKEGEDGTRGHTDAKIFDEDDANKDASGSNKGGGGRGGIMANGRRYKNTRTPLHSRSPYGASPMWWFSPFSSNNNMDSGGNSVNGTPSSVMSTAIGTPMGAKGSFFKRPFPPPSPAKHIQELLLQRHGHGPTKLEGLLRPGAVHNYDHEEGFDLKPPEKYFGYAKNLTIKYEIDENVIGRGHFGHTCRAVITKGERKGQSVAVKVIPKAKMTSAIAIEDVKREVRILKALAGHPNVVKFYDSCEDSANVYIVMELCEGGALLDKLLSRGGKYSEADAKSIVVQILRVVAFCHFQGVVHRDLKPENLLFTTKDDNAQLKVIDFGLSDFVRPDERLKDIVGSAYYVAPEVLLRSYSIEADIWSIGVITYILLSGSRPFWARTESGIFKSVIKTDPSFEEPPWPLLSEEAKDFVKRLLTKDRHRRITAAQALTHPWIRGSERVPLDILVFRQLKCYIRSPGIRRAALKALSNTLSEEQLFYLRAQFALLKPGKAGQICSENLRSVLTKNSTAAMKESKMLDMIAPIEAAPSRKLDFHEFCAAAISVPQLEGFEKWEEQAKEAYQKFEKDGNRVVLIEDLARELGVPSSVPAHVVLHSWVRSTDGKLSFFGFTNLLRGIPPRARQVTK